AVQKFKGRDALLRVHDGKPNTDAEHRVPTGSGSCAQPNSFTAPLSRWGEGSRIQPVTTSSNTHPGVVTIVRDARIIAKTEAAYEI
ncbi:MAG: hypothetical protein L0387_22150, partial [Acidobacteria bacterium]|nr:hypothetical protein [Acidobacteriota bacterium]